MIRRLLALPEIADVDVDGLDRLDVHAAVLERKPMLAAVFRECHELMLALDRRTFGDTPGLRVELGAGVAPIAMTSSEVLATDVVPSPGLDAVIDAQCMDLRDGSVRALYGQNCFHHFPDPARFLAEAVRVLAPGGGVVLIEPYYGPLASVVYKRLFVSEDFDKAMPGWRTDATGPMHGANQALSYIVFKRDRALFEREFPSLRARRDVPAEQLRTLSALRRAELPPARADVHRTGPACTGAGAETGAAGAGAAPRDRLAPARVTPVGDAAGLMFLAGRSPASVLLPHVSYIARVGLYGHDEGRLEFGRGVRGRMRRGDAFEGLALLRWHRRRADDSGVDMALSEDAFFDRSRDRSAVDGFRRCC